MGCSYIISDKSLNKPNDESLLQLVLGSDYKLRNKPENNPDEMEIDLEEEKRSIGIAVVKQGIKFIGEKPYQEKYRVLIIYNADKLTVEAQNSLLKTLEEHPEHALILLVARSAGALLDTISSRCRKLIYKPTEDAHESNTPNNAQNIAINFINMTTGERLAYAEELAKEDRQIIINFLNELSLALVDTANLQNPTELASKLDRILKRIRDLDNTNVATRLALEELFINL